MIVSSSLQEWVKWQVITAAILLINGGIYCLLYPYGTFPFSDSIQIYLGPNHSRGPTNSTENGKYFLAPVTAERGPTIPVIGFIALAAAIFCLALESDFFPVLAPLHQSNLTKAAIYATIGIVCINQILCVQPSVFILFSAILLLYDQHMKNQAENSRIICA